MGNQRAQPDLIASDFFAEDRAPFRTAADAATFDLVIGNAPGGSQLQNPTVWVQVAFDSNLTSAPVAWTTITSAVQDFRTEGGRQHQLDRPQASTFQATLDDRGLVAPGDPFEIEGLAVGLIRNTMLM